MGLGDFVKGALGSVKDSGAAAAIRSWLTREMADYGEVLDFSFNSRARTAELHVLLKGEREKLAVQIEDYEIIAGERDFIVVKRARASREWVNAVLRNFVLNKPHPIPPQYSGIARMILNG
jgi:hypothetical protein